MVAYERNFDAEKAIIAYLKSVSTKKQPSYCSVSYVTKGLKGLYDLKQVRASLRDLQLNKIVKLWDVEYGLTKKAWAPIRELPKGENKK
jgi:hypothetical protein